MTNQNDNEFGPWVQHDGSGCPCVGHYVRIELDRDAEISPDHMLQLSPRTFEGIITEVDAGAAEWDWEWGARIIRYRIRKPRALLDLIQLIADLPAPTQPMKTDGVIA